MQAREFRVKGRIASRFVISALEIEDEPPNMPKWPCSSGPVRKEFGFSGLTNALS
jgi:hypothetical protein